ncbi:MAG: hypothetical protein ACXAEU_26135 [Candidatus Hodarchaeales archaeon]
MLSIGTIILFTSIAISAIFISYTCHKNYLLFKSKINDLESSIESRKERNEHVEYTVSQAWLMKKVITEDGESTKESIRGFFSSGKGGTIALILTIISSGAGFFLGLGLSFFNQETGIQIGGIPIILIVTYVVLIFLSEVIATILFTNEMRKVANDNLGTKDLRVFYRALNILKIRKKQFIVIAILLFLYGFFGGIFDLLVIYLLVFVEVFFITVLGSPAMATIIPVVFLVAAFLSVLVAIVIVYVYAKFCLFLIRIKLPEDLQQLENKR